MPCRTLAVALLSCTAAGAQTSLPATPAAAPRASLSAAAPAGLPHPVLDRLRSTRTMNCGVIKEEEDYARAEDHGNRAGFDIDLCKAVAVATLGSGAHLVIKSYPDEAKAVAALESGEVDLLGSASLTVANTARGLLFSPPVLFDGQSFLLPRNAAVHSPLDLAGKRVCFLTGSHAEAGLHRYADAHKIAYIWYPFSEAGEMEAAFFTTNCDAVTGDLTALANTRGIDPRRSHEFAILPQTIREDTLAMATAGGDERLAAIVRWTVETLLAAEDLGVTQANVHALADSPRPELRTLLSARFGTGTALGLDPRWGAAVLEAVGNYGELFDRDLGGVSSSRLARGENRLWKDGGKLIVITPTDD